MAVFNSLSCYYILFPTYISLEGLPSGFLRDEMCLFLCTNHDVKDHPSQKFLPRFILRPLCREIKVLVMVHGTKMIK